MVGPGIRASPSDQTAYRNRNAPLSGRVFSSGPAYGLKPGFPVVHNTSNRGSGTLTIYNLARSISNRRLTALHRVQARTINSQGYALGLGGRANQSVAAALSPVPVSSIWARWAGKVLDKLTRRAPDRPQVSRLEGAWRPAVPPFHGSMGAANSIILHGGWRALPQPAGQCVPGIGPGDILMLQRPKPTCR